MDNKKNRLKELVKEATEKQWHFQIYTTNGYQMKVQIIEIYDEYMEVVDLGEKNKKKNCKLVFFSAISTIQIHKWEYRSDTVSQQ